MTKLLLLLSKLFLQFIFITGFGSRACCFLLIVSANLFSSLISFPTFHCYCKRESCQNLAKKRKKAIFKKIEFFPNAHRSRLRTLRTYFCISRFYNEKYNYLLRRITREDVFSNELYSILIHL